MNMTERQSIPTIKSSDIDEAQRALAAAQVALARAHEQNAPLLVQLAYERAMLFAEHALVSARGNARAQRELLDEIEGIDFRIESVLESTRGTL